MYVLLQVQGHYSFGPLCVYLAVNYLDRFLSSKQLPVRKLLSCNCTFFFHYQVHEDMFVSRCCRTTHPGCSSFWQLLVYPLLPRWRRLLFPSL
jgi:hypothetical protein